MKGEQKSIYITFMVYDERKLFIVEDTASVP